jgi:hypothetical protein
MDHDRAPSRQEDIDEIFVAREPIHVLALNLR